MHPHLTSPFKGEEFAKVSCGRLHYAKVFMSSYLEGLTPHPGNCSNCTWFLKIGLRSVRQRDLTKQSNRSNLPSANLNGNCFRAKESQQ